MGASQRIRDRRDEILRVAALHGAGNVMLFGSVARGENTPESDVDLRWFSKLRGLTGSPVLDSELLGPSFVRGILRMETRNGTRKLC